MEFHTFITHFTLRTVALQGERKHVSGKKLCQLLYITEVRQINIAQVSRKQEGSESDALNLINAIDSSLCTGDLKTERNYYNLRGCLCKARVCLD